MNVNESLSSRINHAPIAHDQEHANETLEQLFSLTNESEELKSLHELLQENEKVKELLLGIFGCSSFLTSLILRDPQSLSESLHDDPDFRIQKLASNLLSKIRNINSEFEAMEELRKFKNHSALLIALADLSHCWSLDEVTRAITLTADTALKACTHYIFKMANNNGSINPSNLENPELDSGYIVIAMGKHGAHELNYSSDVDLIIFYDKERIKLKNNIEPSSFFVRITKQLVKLMQEITASGYVFRVDLRLRPDPGATQIALSTDAGYSYYESLGQNWERAALIKARPVAGDLQAGEEFLKNISPFIWRKYLDFAAIDDIRAMKRQVHTHKGHAKIAVAGHNIKLGRGGIREIEFFVQTQQLIAGGRQTELRSTQTRKTLELLVNNGWIAPEARDALKKAYCFLRTIEHRLQMIADEQTHTLPEDEVGLTRVANFSGFENLSTFSNELKTTLECVQKYYSDLFEDVPELSGPCGNLVFVGDDPDPDTLTSLSQLGFEDATRAVENVKSWHFGRYPATRSERSRERLTEFQPVLLEALSKTTEPDVALATFDRFLSELPAGVQLFSLLSSNPNLLQLIADIMGTAPRLARVLSRRARILDAVLDPSFFGDLPDDKQLKSIIEAEFKDCSDYQETLDRARLVGQDQSFLIGVRFLSKVITADQAAYAYSRLAENLIAQLQARVETAIEEVHGNFEGGSVAVLAMGKLGGREMTASSDLDLILIYDFKSDQTMSNGKKPLSPTQYYSRYTQRLISALSSPTSEGELYEVDMRLRPSGRAGPVATHINSFIDYQMNKAWVWEHLALTRARVITGPTKLKEKIEDTIYTVLAKQRASNSLAKSVLEMREKIEAEKGSQNIWDIKQIRGGQVDLEFLCQYLQLSHGANHTDIFDANTIACIKKMKNANFIPEKTAEELTKAAYLYNNLIQILRLCTEKPFTGEAAREGLKRRLIEGSNSDNFEDLTKNLLSVQKEILKLFQELIESEAKKQSNNDGTPVL